MTEEMEDALSKRQRGILRKFRKKANERAEAAATRAALGSTR